MMSPNIEYITEPEKSEDFEEWCFETYDINGILLDTYEFNDKEEAERAYMRINYRIIGEEDEFDNLQ